MVRNQVSTVYAAQGEHAVNCDMNLESSVCDQQCPSDPEL